MFGVLYCNNCTEQVNWKLHNRPTHKWAYSTTRQDFILTNSLIMLVKSIKLRVFICSSD